MFAIARHSAFLLFLIPCPIASADLIDVPNLDGVKYNVVTDTESQLKVEFLGGPIAGTANSNPFQILDGMLPTHWSLTMANIGLLSGNDFEQVTLLGNVAHTRSHDPDEGTGDLMTFNVGFSSKANGFEKFIQMNEMAVPELAVDHGDHEDLYTILMTGQRSGFQMQAWTMTLQGTHIPTLPTPGALALLGLAGVVHRRRRSRSVG